MNKLHALLGIVIVAGIYTLNTLHYIDSTAAFWLVIAAVVVAFS